MYVIHFSNNIFINIINPDYFIIINLVIFHFNIIIIINLYVFKVQMLNFIFIIR